MRELTLNSGRAVRRVVHHVDHSKSLRCYASFASELKLYGGLARARFSSKARNATHSMHTIGQPSRGLGRHERPPTMHASRGASCVGRRAAAKLRRLARKTMTWCDHRTLAGRDAADRYLDPTADYQQITTGWWNGSRSRSCRIVPGKTRYMRCRWPYPQTGCRWG